MKFMTRDVEKHYNLVYNYRKQKISKIVFFFTGQFHIITELLEIGRRQTLFILVYSQYVT